MTRATYDIKVHDLFFFFEEPPRFSEVKKDKPFLTPLQLETRF